MLYSYTENVFVNCPFDGYQLFKSALPDICEGLKLTIDEMIFNDYTAVVYEWLRGNRVGR